MQTIAVIDFETTGSGPESGARATEIAAVLLRDGEVVDRYQSLMFTGAWVPPFIEQLTGISNEMLESAPPARQVMQEVADFVGDRPMAAHNAAFDRKFWQAELSHAGCRAGHAFACTLLLARRLYPGSPNHKLGTLAAVHELPDAGRAHRALADALTAAHLLALLQDEVQRRYGLDHAPHELLLQLQRTPRQSLGEAVARWRDAAHARG